MVGIPVELDWFVASNSLGAFDITVSNMMGQNWEKVKHLKSAYNQGFIPEQSEIEIIGDYEKLGRQFVLRRTFWNYPALAAFRSKLLSYLFYFSPISKLLHDIMYTFRKRPVE